MRERDPTDRRQMVLQMHLDNDTMADAPELEVGVGDIYDAGLVLDTDRADACSPEGTLTLISESETTKNGASVPLNWTENTPVKRKP